VFSNVRRVMLPDGTRITARFAGAIHQVTIDVRGVVKSVDKYCRDFLSGLLTAEQIALHTDTDSAGNEITYNALEWLYLSEYQKLVTPKLPAKYASPEFADVRLVRQGFSDIPVKFTRIYAAAYSGAMRQAIQLLLGTGLDLVRQLPSGSVYNIYNYGYSGTHGLVKKAGGSPDRPEFWLVRMPVGGEGVLAMHFPVCHEVTPAQKARGVHWVPEGIIEFPLDIQAAIENGSVIEVLSAEDFFAATSGYGPMYPDCGWAFSLSGHECQNVLFSVTTVATDDYRVRTKRVTLRFTVQTSTPKISATIEASEPGMYFGTKGTVPRFPVGDTLIPHEESYAAPHPTYTGDSACPVHVFYKGDVAQVFSYYYTPPSTVSEYSGTYFNASPSLAYPIVTYVPVAGIYRGFNKYTGFTSAGYKLNGGEVTVDSFDGSGTEYCFSIVSLSDGEVTTPPPPPYLGVTGGFNDLEGVIVHEVGDPVAMRDNYSRQYASRTSYPLLFVPFHQREGVYVMSAKHVTQMGCYNYPYQFLGYTSGMGIHYIKVDAPNGCGFEHPHVEQFAAGSKGVMEVTYPPHPSYTSEKTPPVTRYTMFLGAGGGVGLNSLSGCYPEILFGYGIPSEADGGQVYTPGFTEWSGGLTFYSSGESVYIPFGSSTDETIANPVRAKIIAISSTTYLDDNTAMWAFGLTDGIDPEKYIVFDMINTYSGEHALTNTSYPVNEITGWERSFVGIAN